MARVVGNLYQTAFTRNPNGTFGNPIVILPSSHVTILAALAQVQTSNGEVDAFSRIDYYVSNGVIFRPDNATILTVDDVTEVGLAVDVGVGGATGNLTVFAYTNVPDV
jgi:hypothetical protein